MPRVAEVIRRTFLCMIGMVLLPRARAQSPAVAEWLRHTNMKLGEPHRYDDLEITPIEPDGPLSNSFNLILLSESRAADHAVITAFYRSSIFDKDGTEIPLLLSRRVDVWAPRGVRVMSDPIREPWNSVVFIRVKTLRTVNEFEFR